MSLFFSKTLPEGYGKELYLVASPKASRASIKVSIVFSSFRPMTGRSFQNRESSENLGRDSSAGSDRR